MPKLNQYTTTVTIGTDPTEIGPFPNAGSGWVANLDFANVADGEDLTTCKIQTRATADSPWRDYFGGSDWASTSDGRNIFTSSVSPATLAANTGANAMIVVCGVDAIRLIATVASGTTSLTVGLSWSGTNSR